MLYQKFVFSTKSYIFEVKDKIVLTKKQRGIHGVD